MNHFSKSITGTILLLLTMMSVKSQSTEECKYLTVLTYIRTNTAVNDKIKAFFPWAAKKKDKYVEFNLSDRIDFIGISHFKEKLMAKKYGMNEDLIADDKTYHKKYFFESYTSDFLKRITERNESKLFLTFSKLIENYLVVELGDFDPEINRKIKYGKGMLMFFKFDSSGGIEDVLYAGAAYN